MRFLLILLMSLSLAACGSPDQPAGEEPTGDETADDPLPDTVSENAAVILESDGLGLDQAGVIVRLAFEQADQATATSTLEAVLGEPTATETDLECGPGVLDSVSWDGLDVYFLDDTFAGWYLQEPQPAQMTTTEGVGVGSSRMEVEEAYDDATVEETSLGTEWSGGGVSGIFSGDTDDTTVEATWAGATCIAR